MIQVVYLVVCLGLQADNDISIEKLYRQLEKHEGKRTKVYKDSRGISTIGIGFNLERAGAKKSIEALGLDYSKILGGCAPSLILSASGCFIGGGMGLLGRLVFRERHGGLSGGHGADRRRRDHACTRYCTRASFGKRLLRLVFKSRLCRPALCGALLSPRLNVQ